MKKAISFILAVIIAVSALPFCVFAIRLELSKNIPYYGEFSDPGSATHTNIRITGIAGNGRWEVDTDSVPVNYYGYELSPLISEINRSRNEKTELDSYVLYGRNDGCFISYTNN